MADIVSSAGAALQAVLTGDLIKDLSQALATGSVTDAPPSIQNATSPMAISGTLASQLQDGGAVVQTVAGPVTLALDKPPVLPQGTLTLLIQPGNPPTASVMAQQAVTPQAQIQTQSTAAQQTQQSQQAQAQAALPPLTVGQVLTATPLPAAPVAVTGPGTPLPDTMAAPVVAAATSGSPSTTPSPVQTPTAVLLSAAVAPTPPAPPAAFLGADGRAPAQPQAEPQPQAPTYQQQSPLQPALQLISGASPSEHEAEELTPQANMLAAQESANEDSSQPALAYTPAQTVPNAQPQASQSFVVLSIETPGQQQSAASQTGLATPQMPQNVTATVIAQTGSGQPLLSTPAGALLVDQPVSTQVGTELVLQRLTPAQAQAAPQNGQNASSSGPAPLNDVPLSISRQQSWPALTQLLGTLDHSAPEASAFLRQALPALGGGFVQAFTAFLSRGAQPTLSAALPDTVKVALAAPQSSTTTQELRSALLQLGDDFTVSAGKGNAAATPAQPWQSHQVPIVTDYGISMAQLFVRQQIDPLDDEPGRKPGGSSTRFLVEISPSKLGPVQLDGLLRKGKSQLDRLDLIVRTEFAVSPDAGTEMQDVFRASLGATGLAGNLGFQTGPENFVLPASGADPHYRGNI